MNQAVDLGTVLGNTFSNLSWTGFTLFCAIIVVGALWFILPFAVFGVKRRLDAIESAQRHQTELLLGEMRRTNELLVRRPAGAAATQDRTRGGQGKRVTVRVVPCGPRVINTKREQIRHKI